MPDSLLRKYVGQLVLTLIDDARSLPTPLKQRLEPSAEEQEISPPEKPRRVNPSPNWPQSKPPGTSSSTDLLPPIDDREPASAFKMVNELAPETQLNFGDEPLWKDEARYNRQRRREEREEALERQQHRYKHQTSQPLPDWMNDPSLLPKRPPGK